MKILLLLLLVPILAFSQDCMSDYKALMKEADKLAHQSKPDYQGALNTYDAASLAAKDCGQDKSTEIKKAISDLFTQIDNQRKEAEKAKKKIETTLRLLKKEKKNAEVAQKAATDALEQVDEEHKRNKKIVDAFYFHEGKFALAYKNGRYGFIDRNGDPSIPYHYSEASPFSPVTGYAKVKKSGVPYLLDVNQREYTFAEDLATIKNRQRRVQAFEYNNRRSGAFPLPVLAKTELQILLYLSNDLEELPEDIDRLQRLQEVNLSDNLLRNLPERFCNLKNLQRLRINRNKLGSLPSTLGQLEDLEALEVNHNEIAELPQNIGQLSKLKKLYLFENKISQLPASFIQLVNLEKLLLADNALTALPEDISKLQNLQLLSLSRNQLTSIPKSIAQLKQLKMLRLEGNPIPEDQRKEIESWLPNCTIVWGK